MTSVLNVLCCAGNCFCHGLNNICEDTKKINPKLFSRIGFIILSFISVAFSLIVLFFAPGLFGFMNDFIQCPKDNNLDCLGISSVYRMSLSLVFLHFIVIVFSLCGKNCSKVMNRDCWTFKFFLVFGVYVALFFIPNSLFSVYAEVSRYFSLLFLTYQLLVTISFAHVINIKLVEGLDTSAELKYKFWLIFLTFVFFALSLFWILTSYLNFSDRLYNILIITFCTVIFGTAFTLLSVSNIVTRKRLLTSIYILSYISYLTWSALNSQPNDQTAEESKKLNALDILVGVFYMFSALAYLGFFIKKAPNAGLSGDKAQSEEQKQINKSPMLEEEKEERKDQELLINEAEDKDDEVSAAYYYFHIFMMFMSIYYCMLLTNWSITNEDMTNPILMAQSWESFWIKLASVIITCLLYTWILIAPKLFPDREFDF